MKRIFAILLAIALTAALFAGCGAGESETSRTTSPGDPAPSKTTQDQAGEFGALTQDIFAVYTEGGTYHVKYVGPMAGGGRATTEVYAKGSDLAIMCPDDPDFDRIVIKGGYFYQVSDSRKIAVKAPIDDTITWPIPPDLSALRFVGSGRTNFKGEELDYDEYNHHAGFRAFYFVKGGVLKGIRHAEEGFPNIDVEYLVFEKEAPDSVFDVPADYTVIG